MEFGGKFCIIYIIIIIIIIIITLFSSFLDVSTSSCAPFDNYLIFFFHFPLSFLFLPLIAFPPPTVL